MREPCPLRDLIAHEVEFARQMDAQADREGRATDGTVWRRIAKVKRAYDVLQGKARAADALAFGEINAEEFLRRVAACEAERLRPVERGERVA